MTLQTQTAFSTSETLLLTASSVTKPLSCHKHGDRACALVEGICDGQQCAVGSDMFSSG